jgi:CRP-like cAMP-binding protein
LLDLRTINGFEDAELADLTSLAENVTERTFEPGVLVAGTRSRTAAIHIVLEGRLTAPSGRSWGPAEVCGSLEAMGRRRMSEDVYAEERTRTLQLSAAAFREILEDNYGLLTSVRRALGRQLHELPITFETFDVPEAVSELPLGMVERLMLLRRRMPFGRGRIEALAALAQAAEEVRLPANAELAVAGEAVSSTLVILEGRVRVTRGASTVVVGPGYVVGSLEALAELPHTSTCVALTPVRALRCPSSVIFDVLEDHTDLALAMIESLAAALVDLGAIQRPAHELN